MTLGKPKITIVVDNDANEGLAAEHGLSLWIEAHNMRILFDTGQKKAFEHNLRQLDIDLKKKQCPCP